MATYNQVNDAIKGALVKELHNGDNINELLISWLASEGAVGTNLMQLWRAFFNLKGIAQGQHTERLKGWYTQAGF